MSSVNDNSYIPAKHPLALLCTVMLTTVVTSIDATIANVALPHMQGSLSATQDQIAWVLTSYIVATAIFIPPTGFLAARLGRQQLLLWCVGGFLVSSMLCGAATSLTEMVVFRVMQGAFGAGMSPLSQAIVMDHFPPEKRGQVLSIWGVGSMFGPVIGPSLGGYLTESLNWRWVFYVNVPICLVALVGVWKTVPHTKIQSAVRFDMFGFSLLSLAVGTFQLMLDRGQSASWFDSPEIIIEATIGALCGYLFLVHMFTSKTAFMEPRIFRDRNFVAGLFMVALTNVILMAQMALLPNYLQQLMHIPVDTTGLLMMPRGIASMAGMLFTSRLIGKADVRKLMFFGLVLLTLSMYEMSRINLYVDNFTIMRIAFQQGFGMSFLFAPMTTAVFSTLAADLRTEGAAIFSLMRNIGGSIGISVLFSRVAQQSQIAHARLAEGITPFSAKELLPQAWQWSSAAGAMSLDAEVTRQAASVAYLNGYMFLAVLALLTIPLCFLFTDTRKNSSPDIEILAADH